MATKIHGLGAAQLRSSPLLRYSLLTGLIELPQGNQAPIFGQNMGYLVHILIDSLLVYGFSVSFCFVDSRMHIESDMGGQQKNSSRCCMMTTGFSWCQSSFS